jgi:hypothetical protein
MQQQWPTGRKVSRAHLSAASMDSGIADSTLSFGTMVTEDSIRLSQFPPVPNELPSTPLQSEFGPPSPSRSASTVGNHHGRGFWEHPRRSPAVPNRTVPVGISQREANSPAMTVPTLPDRNHLPHHPLPQPPFVAAARSHGSERSPQFSSRTLSPHDWHEGSSSIFVDAAEERLLSTSFITNLLSSTDDTSEESHAPSRTQGRRASQRPVNFNDGASAFSEMTYPPISHYQNLPPAYHPDSPETPSSSAPFLRNHTQPQHSVHQTADGGRETGAIIRTASTARRLGVQGASVVGIAPAALRSVSGQGVVQPYSRQDGDKIPFGYPEDDASMNFGAPSHPNSTPSSIPARGGNRRRRQSIVSTRTTVSFVPSFISRLSSGSGLRTGFKQAFSWSRAKPLPPLPGRPPLPPMPPPHEGNRRTEDAMLLPDLVNRAGQLSHMLEKGHYPHRSVYSSNSYDPKFRESPHATYGQVSERSGMNELWKYQPTPGGPQESVADAIPGRQPMSRRKKKLCITFCIIALCVIGGCVAAAVIVTQKGHSSHTCTGNFTGARCDMDATCVCTSSLPSQCNQLAQSLVDLTPTLNNFFGMNFSTSDISTAIWIAQGPPTGTNCASQANLIDVGSALNSQTFPNRTQWAQSALLWNLVRSQDLVAVSTMQKFVAKAPWQSLGSADRPAAPSPKFTISASGYAFDFGAQAVTQPSVSFVSNGQATSAQLAQVSSSIVTVLDRMYTQALASSTQASAAIGLYWQSVLQQKPENLALFMSAISSSPIIIPFDATLSLASQPIANLLTNSSTSAFPPPIGCYPGLDSSQIQRINTIETTVFGLPTLTAATNFDPTCFPTRPQYGILDVLRLRLPFVDSRTGLAKQAVVLNRDVAPRGVIYNGEILSALPNVQNPPSILTTQLDLRQYGTINHLNRVVLNYLSSFPDVPTAIAFVNFVLSSPAAPPTNTSALFSALSTLPVLEVAIFGNIDPSDISSSLSSFATPSGSLFFGSDQAAALRDWAINAGSSVVWTELATSPEVVRDSSFTNAAFNSVWNPASTILHSQQPGVIVGVSNVTAAFDATGQFVP